VCPVGSPLVNPLVSLQASPLASLVASLVASPPVCPVGSPLVSLLVSLQASPLASPAVSLLVSLVASLQASLQASLVASRLVSLRGSPRRFLLVSPRASPLVVLLVNQRGFQPVSLLVNLLASRRGNQLGFQRESRLANPPVSRHRRLRLSRRSNAMLKSGTSVACAAVDCVATAAPDMDSALRTSIASATWAPVESPSGQVATAPSVPVHMRSPGLGSTTARTICTRGPSAPTRVYVTEKQALVTALTGMRAWPASAHRVPWVAMAGESAGRRRCWRRVPGGNTLLPGTVTRKSGACATLATAALPVSFRSVHRGQIPLEGTAMRPAETVPGEEPVTTPRVCASALLVSLATDARTSLRWCKLCVPVAKLYIIMLM
jgi:hypothetical protein